MRVFARFDDTGICQGNIVTYDPSFKPQAPYEEVFDTQERILVQSGQCKKMQTETGQRIIVIL